LAKKNPPQCASRRRRPATSEKDVYVAVLALYKAIGGVSSTGMIKPVATVVLARSSPTDVDGKGQSIPTAEPKKPKPAEEIRKLSAVAAEPSGCAQNE